MPGEKLQNLWCDPHIAGFTLARDGGGGQLSDDDRKDLLERARKGEAIALSMDIEAFSQLEGVPNANNVVFKKSALSRFARSFINVPFIRDHQSYDSSARAGIVTKSKAVAVEGGYVFEMTLRITAQWAVVAALEGNIDRFSIGWSPGPRKSILCSVCNSAYNKCSHYRGDEMDDGSVVSVVFTAPKAREVSSVIDPAVTGTTVAGIEAVLSALSENPVTPIVEDQSMNELAKALGLKTDASESTMLAALSALKAKSTSEAQVIVDLTKTNAETTATLAAANQRIKELESSAQAVTIDQLMSANVDRFPVERDGAGKVVTSALEKSMRELAVNDIDAATKIISTLPIVSPVAARLQTDESEIVNAPPAKDSGAYEEVSGELKSQLEQFGLSAEEYAKYNPVNGTHLSN